MPRSTDTVNRLPAVVLAAGGSERFAEGNKLLAPIDGRPLLAHAIRACQRARLVDPVVVVLGHEADRVKSALQAQVDAADVVALVNERWQGGLSTTIHTAIDALPESAPGALFVPGDMPLMTSALIGRVAETVLSTNRICFPTVDDRKGHPTGIPRRFFDQLRQLEGDVGAREVVRIHGADTVKMALHTGQASTQVDIDTPTDKKRVSSSIAASRPDADNGGTSAGR